MEWISTKNKFPSLGESVVIVHNGAASEVLLNQPPNKRFAYLYKTALSGDKWMVECRYTGSVYIVEKNEVLYWMPLPTLFPEEVEK